MTFLTMCEAPFFGRPVQAVAAALVESLTLHHRDSFNRLVTTEAISKQARFYSPDPALLRYSKLVTLVR